MFTEDVVAFYLGAKRARDALLVQNRRALRGGGHRGRVPDRAVGAAVDLRYRDAVRVCGLFGADAAARRRAVLERQHTLGRAGDTVWTAAAVFAIAALQSVVPAPAPGAAIPILSIGEVDIITRAAAGTMVMGLLPVVPMT